jgi:hypothetical protein
MHIFDISFFDDETGENFELTKEVDGDHISSDLNMMVGLLRLIGYGDDTIRGYIGSTYFAPPLVGGIELDAALQEAIDEYQISRDLSDRRLDDTTDYLEI